MNKQYVRLVGVLLLIILLGVSGGIARAQDPTPFPPNPPSPAPTPAPVTPGGIQIPGAQELDKVYAIVRMVTDLAQGKMTPNPDSFFTQARQGATDLLSQPGAGVFFLDFADPNLGINQFAASVA